MADRISTEELHLVYRVLAALADENPQDYVPRLIFEAAADLVRVAYRARTLHDPIWGQLDFDGLIPPYDVQPTT